MTLALRFMVIHERNWMVSTEMSFFVMPLYIPRSGPDNRDLIDGDYDNIITLQ